MKYLIPLAVLIAASGVLADKPEHISVQMPSAATLEAQNAALSQNTDGKGYGPQSPRDLTTHKGQNPRVFVAAPAHTQMNLCNIHFEPPRLSRRPIGLS